MTRILTFKLPKFESHINNLNCSVKDFYWSDLTLMIDRSTVGFAAAVDGTDVTVVVGSSELQAKGSPEVAGVVKSVLHLRIIGYSSCVCILLNDLC